MENHDTTNTSILRDRAQMECWALTIKGLQEKYNWSPFKIAEWLLRQPHDIFEALLYEYGGIWGNKLKELGGAK